MTLRFSNLQQLRNETFDVAIVGGGINGAVSAAALSAHGVKVALIDRGDFANVTSQESSNLAWGGIKYLETGELRLVRNLCRSRNRLITAYPSSINEIRFLVTVERGFRRSPFTLNLGAWLYWLIGDGFTRPPRLLSTQALEREEPSLNVSISDGGFEFSDAYLLDTDARFVFGFVRTALERGAAAVNYVESLGSSRDDNGLWRTRARDTIAGETFEIRSRVVVNACGPSVDALNERNGIVTRHKHLFSKGVHLIVDQVSEANRVLTFFADDGRLFFVIPLGGRSCIGTTDTRVNDLPATVTPEDRHFILDNINKRLRLKRPLRESDIIAERCGVRPLAVMRSHLDSDNSEWTALSRRHAIETNPDLNHVSIFGGKITDCINIGSEMLAVMHSLGVSGSDAPSAAWYGEPGLDVKSEVMRRARELKLDEVNTREPLRTRWWRRYGASALTLLDRVAKDPHALQIVMPGTEFTRAELEYVARYEMIVTLEDFLRRRSKLALTMRREDLANLPGLRAACEILFGNDAQARYREYFSGSPPSRG